MLNQRPEYKTLKSNRIISKMAELLNDEAKEGWRLVTSSDASDGPYLILVRMVDIEPTIDRTKDILKHVQRTDYD